MKIDILSIGLDPILQFESVARLQSLKKAAEELHVSQSAITQSLNKLEKNLGVLLCERSRTAFVLTEPGRKLYGVSKSFKNDLRSYQAYLAKDTEFDGLLSVGIIDSFLNKNFENALEQTIKQFPKMRLSLQVHAATEIQTLVAAGEIDAGLGIFNRKLDQLTYRVVGHETIQHFISERHPLWSTRNTKTVDMSKHSKTWVDIINRDRSALNAEVFNDLNQATVKIRSYVNNLNTAVLVLQGGTSIVPLPVEYLEARKLDFKYRALNKAFPQYSLKQELTMKRELLNSSPAARYFVEQLPSA